MTTIFIGGSRKISRLSADMRERLNRIIHNNFHVIVGDANGADKAVQSYFKAKQYPLVEVFCAGNACRNNVGTWPTRNISADNLRGFDFYAAKDRVMAKEATYGLMLWDGKSIGTLMNVLRLIDQGKIVVIYVAPEKEFVDLRNSTDLQSLIQRYAPDLKTKIIEQAKSEEKISRSQSQINLF